MKTPKSVVQRALDVVSAIARGGEHVSLPAIAAQASLPVPTAYRLLRELSDLGWVHRERTGPGGFSAGPHLEQLALALVQSGGARAARHAVLSRLVADLGETCNVTVLDRNQVLYLDRVESTSPLRANLQPGSRVPLHCTASGKLFLARLPKARRARLMAETDLNSLTERTIIDRGALAAELERIRTQGYSIDNEEYIAGLVCVAVPVVDVRGKTIAAVAVQAPTVRLSLARTPKVLPALRRAAREIEETYRIGGRR